MRSEETKALGAVGRRPTGVCFRLLTPPPAGGSAGAIATIELRGSAANIDAGLERLGIRALATGQAALRTWPGVDTVMAARVTPEVLGHAADAALRQGRAGRDTLPGEPSGGRGWRDDRSTGRERATGGSSAMAGDGDGWTIGRRRRGSYRAASSNQSLASVSSPASWQRRPS